MLRRLGFLPRFCVLLAAAAVAQATPSKPATAKADYSQEAFVIERFSAKESFENDGTSSLVESAQIRIQSEAGVQRYGVLAFSYASATGSLDIGYVRVHKPDGSVIETPPDSAQDMAAQITREAPLYSDLHEKQIAVKGLSVGDVLEYHIDEHTTKPLAPGQFWSAYRFTHEAIVLSEDYEIDVPRGRAIKLKSASIQPVITESGDRRIYTWHSSNLREKDKTNEKREATEQVWKTARGRLPAPDVQMSTFTSWEEVGRWYAQLQEDRVRPSPEITAKAAELTKNAATPEAKIRALYAYVSTQFHYIGIDFGIGRYQPHSAAEVLANQYGDCKDKHTLLAALLTAVGIPAYPALISAAQEVDQDVPSPGQFNHVITVVPREGGLLWLDSTAEVGPYQYLVPPLLDKHALVIWSDQPAALLATPTDLPYPTTQTFKMDAQLSDDGTLVGQADLSSRGDVEFVLRTVFRSTPLQQWQELAQRISASQGFGGEVSEATASLPEKTDESFTVSYKYTRKNFGDWDNRRILAPEPFISLPAPDTEEDLPLGPSWLGPLVDIHFTSSVELPAGYTALLPPAVHVKHDFAQFDATYDLKDGKLLGDRHFKTLMHEVPVAEREEYIQLAKSMQDDYGVFISLISRAPSSASAENSNASVALPSGIENLPMSSNEEATRLAGEAREAVANHDLQTAEADLYRAVAADPKFTRAWILLGNVLLAQKQNEAGIDAFHKAMALAPDVSAIPKGLGEMLMSAGKFQDALPVWQEFIKAYPQDIDGPSNLGICLFQLGRTAEAASVYEAAVKIHPESAALQGNLGIMYLRAGQNDKAGPVFAKLASLSPDINTFNNVAYEMANADFQLPAALDLAIKAVRGAEEQSQKINLPDLSMPNVGQVFQLSAYWDTLGWVYERMSNLNLAEQYLRAAWKSTQIGVSAGHLCHLYRRTHQTSQAIEMCRMAIYRMPKGGAAGSQNNTELAAARENLDSLLHGPRKTNPAGIPVAGNDTGDVAAKISDERTFKLPRFLPGTESAEFFVLLASDGKSKTFKVDDTKFISGSDKMKAQGKQLKSIDFNVPAPSDVPTHFVRRGILGCYQYTGCSFVLLDPATVTSLN